MFDARSRYRNQPTRELTLADGTVVRHIVPRFIPEASRATVAVNHRATDSDRIDNLAHRYLGVATAWWMIADASEAMHPDSIADAPGEIVAIPLPGTGQVSG